MPSRKGPLSGRLAGGRPGSRRAICAAVTLLVLFVLSSLWTPVTTAAPTSPAPNQAPAGTVASLTDNQQISLTVLGIKYTLSDSIVTESLGPSIRSYEIVLTTNLPLLGDLVGVSTTPVTQWAGPGQVPGGPDNLPPLSDWDWTIFRGSTNVTSDWAADLSTGVIERDLSWANATYTVTGTPEVTVPIEVTPGPATGPVAPTAGVFMSGGIPGNNPGYSSLAKSLDPGIIRVSQTYLAPATWDKTKGTVSFNFTQFSKVMSLAEAIGAQVYLSLPAGSWGDGNLLPAGMPLNSSFWVNWWNHGSGYYPALGAYRTYLTTFANDVVAHGWTINYWNIGNEVPVGFNKSVASTFVTLFNSAAADIHSVLPHALVSSDVFTWPTKEKYFAGVVKGAGFLSFHIYPATGLCANPAKYCPPDNVGGYLTDSQILANSDYYASDPWTTSPLWSQDTWYNVTGQWLPTIDSETNLNSAQTRGFDPRAPTLFNAAFLISQLVDGAAQNLSSLIVYSYSEGWPPTASPTEAYGGWGNGITAAESNGDNLVFAPYWALDLWDEAIPTGAHGLPLADADSSAVRAFAAGSSSKISVIVANREGVDVTIPIQSSNSNWVATSATTLDQSTYDMVYSTSAHKEELLSSGLGHPSASERSSMTITLNGYGVAVVTFEPVAPSDHSVDFTETGLPTGQNWSVTLAGTTHSSTGTTVSFSEPNGTYSYTVPAVAGFRVDPDEGSVTVTGATKTAISFTEIVPKYPVSFLQSGLPTGTNWSVTLGASTVYSTQPSIVFHVPNGQYDYAAGAIVGYAATPSSGSVTVSGAGDNTTVAFAPLPPGVYPVAFNETGLGPGTNWSVTLGTQVRSSNTSQIEFVRMNGTYAYSVGSVAGFHVSGRSGQLTVAGNLVSVGFAFLALPPTSYNVTIAESGLKPGIPWSGALGSAAFHSTNSSVVLAEPNGTYNYKLTPVDGYLLASSSGSVTVHGAPVTIDVAYAFPPVPNGTPPVTTGPAVGPSPNPSSGGMGGVLLGWLSLGFLKPAVGASGLAAVQVAFAIALVLAIALLVTHWPGRPRARRTRSKGRRATGARAVKLSSGLRPGFRAPPSRAGTSTQSRQP
jgi:hypothetical protein